MLARICLVIKYGTESEKTSKVQTDRYTARDKDFGIGNQDKKFGIFQLNIHLK